MLAARTDANRERTLAAAPPVNKQKSAVHEAVHLFHLRQNTNFSPVMMIMHYVIRAERVRLDLSNLTEFNLDPA